MITRHNPRSDELTNDMHDDLGGQGRTEKSVQVFCKLLSAWDLRTIFPILRDLGSCETLGKGSAKRF